MPTAVEQIIFTAIPNGVPTGTNVGMFNLSVHVAPTLSGGATGTLSDFPDFQNWPQTVINQGLDLEFTFANQTKSNTVSPSPTARIDTSVLNPNLWTALFSPASGIQYSARDASEPYTSVPVVSYPSDQVASFLKSTYTNLAVGSPKSYPSLESLQSIYNNGNDPLGYVGPAGARELNDLWAELATIRVSSPATHAGPIPWTNNWTGASAGTAMAALRFYHMAAGPGLSHAAVSPSLPVVDFHRALTFINQHPALQRALGLVFDVAIDQRNVEQLINATLSSNVYVSVVPINVNGGAFTPSNGVTYQPVSPRVQCDASTSEFQAHAVTPQIVGRQLTLGDATSFSVYEIDVDGGGLHTAQFADNLALARTPQSNDPGSGNGAAPDAPSSYAPPSLRSIGLTVAAVNRGVKFVNTLQRSASLMAGLPNNVPDLTAEDLVKGYVLDVYDAPAKAWHSTAMRDVTYTATGVTGSLQTSDEPGTDAPPRSQSDPTSSSQKQLNLPENLIRWNGWSNAAPRPGLPLQDDGSAAAGGADPGPFSQLQITVAPTAGTLPRLRYGEAYALRARVVDIAGNVILLSDGAPLGDGSQRVSPLSVYGRHEPIGSPDMYNWDSPLPGESLKRLVIRDLDAALGSLRALAPNRIAESFAELHGVFDVSSDGAISLSQGAYTTIVDRESARYPSGPITFTSPVPYLPDPLARGGTLYEVQGALAGNAYRFDFSPASGQSWPKYQPFGLLLMPGSSQAVNVDSTKRQVTFNLTKGDTVIVQLSSRINTGDLGMLGMYNWISQFYGGAVPAAFQQDAVNGLHWSMTPFTTVQLVYAVQKPLLAPAFPVMGPLKQLGWTYAEIFGDLTYSPKSTARTDLLANWGEPVDNGPDAVAPQGPGAPDTTLKPMMSTVFTIPSSHEQRATETDRFEGRHEFFDTKHRVVSYSGKSTSAFTEHYQGTDSLIVPSPGTPKALALPGHPGLGLEDGSVKVTGTNGTEYHENTAFTLNTTAGTITFIAPPAGPPTGSTVQIEFLPPVSVETVKPTTLNILSSARPLAPDVAFIVPIYEWRKVHATPSAVLSGRSPSALRIFMSRPWWSSGIGELLGVVTWPEAEKRDIVSTISPTDELYVSDWGADPVFAGPALPSAHPRLESFPKRVHTGKNLTIDENAGVRVNVAGHAVQYDPGRDLWYSDVIVDIGHAYTPMIRLGLARYQPESVPGAELSRIVLADVMSLEPGRVVAIRRKGHVLTTVQLAGYSYSKNGHDSGDGPGVAELVLERRVPEIHDEVLGWEPVAKPIRMNPSKGKDGLTIWTARDIKVPPSGKYRLFIAQYEVIPDDRRKNSVYSTYVPSRGLRILYQDLIPL
jgi:hypothetical protein